GRRDLAPAGDSIGALARSRLQSAAKRPVHAQSPAVVTRPTRRGNRMQPTLRRASAALLGATVLAGSFATTVAAADPSTTTMTIDTLGHAPQENHAFKLTATVSPTPAGWDTDATIAFVDADGSAVGCAAAPVDAVNDQ